MIDVKKLSHQVYKHLLREILAGRLTSGTTLQETELATRLGVSRTPVREGLRRLAADGLLEIHPHRSPVVRRLGREQLVHIYQVREALEGMAAELACGRLAVADFARLEKLAGAARNENSPNYVAACHKFDLELHRLVAKRSGNPVLAREIWKFHDVVQLVREQVGNRDGTLAEGYQEHLELIAALKAEDPVKSRQAMIEHIHRSCDTAVRYGATDALTPPTEARPSARGDYSRLANEKGVTRIAPGRKVPV